MAKDDIGVIKFTNMRHCIGLLGLALPFIIVLQVKCMGTCHYMQDSISHYFYTFSAPWFVGILWGLGLVLIFYPTPPEKDTLYFGCPLGICKVLKPKLDGILTTIAGFCSICVSLVPTNNSKSLEACANFTYPYSDFRAGIHYAAAAGMLLIFSYMSICIFTRTDDKHWRENKWKVRRNNVYMFCGIITFLSVATAGALAIAERCFHVNVYAKSTYWLEVGALVPFGFSWLVKGGFILTDEDEPSTVEQAKSLVTKGRLVKSKKE
jgi:hypothetical protein